MENWGNEPRLTAFVFSQESYTKEGKGSKVLLNNKQYDWEGVFSLGKLAKRFECNWMKLLSEVTGE